MNELSMNPYVVQMDKFAKSLEKLSRIFVNLEENKNFFSEEEITHICERVCKKVCRHCEMREDCLERNRYRIYELLCEIFQAIEAKQRNSRLFLLIPFEISPNSKV